MDRTRTESTARKKIIAAVNKLIPKLLSDDFSARMDARETLGALQAAAELLLSLSSAAPAPAAPEAEGV